MLGLRRGSNVQLKLSSEIPTDPHNSGATTRLCNYCRKGSPWRIFSPRNLQRAEKKLAPQLVSIYGERGGVIVVCVLELRPRYLDYFICRLKYAGCRCLPHKLCKWTWIKKPGSSALMQYLEKKHRYLTRLWLLD